ncbi:MAG: hypothetical protein DRI71_06640 [Bacteroidetes bacterium]|nr:MAG: hypothetical protein DRI71_06640 [Bacteroidota bacterium]
MQDNHYLGEMSGSYPSPTVPNSQKNKAYILQYGRSMYRAWTTSGAGGFYLDRSRKLYAQSYRLGLQDPTKIKSLMNLKGDIVEANVNYDPLPIVQKFADLMVNNILNNNYKLKLEFVDNIAVEKKDAYRTNLEETMLRKPIADLLTQVTGVDVRDKNVPADDEDLELMLEVDYRDVDEISLLNLINSIKTTNGYPDIAREIVDDLVTFNEIATRQRVDEKEGIVIEYVNDMNFIRSVSKDKSNKNLQHAGEVKTITFSELRQRIKAIDGITDDDLNDLAKGVAANTGGYSGVDWNDPVYKDRIYGGNRWYDELSVDILEFEFMDVNYDLYEKKQTKLGLPVIHKRPDGYVLPKESRFDGDFRELFTDAYQTVYKGAWIIDSDFMFDSGRADNVLMQGKDLSKARLNYTVYTIQGKSMVERMIAYADQMWITHIKHQHLISRLRPAGVSVNVSALEDALEKKDGEYYEPLDLMNYYNVTGDALYRDDSEEEGLPRRGDPIKPMPNVMGSQLTELTVVYNHNLDIIRDMTNINKFMDGSQVSSKTLVGVQKQGIEQSNMGIEHLRYAYEFAVKDNAKVLIMMIQDVFKYSNVIEAYTKSVGKYSMDVIKRIKNIPIEQLNIVIEYGMTEYEEATLNQDINVSIQAGELRIEDAIMIREIDDIRLANKMLIKRKKIYAKEKAQEQEAIHKQNMEAKKADSDAKAQQVQMEAQAKAQGEIMVLNTKFNLEKLDKIQSQKDAKELLNLEYGHKKDITRIEAESQKGKLDMQEQSKDRRADKTKSQESKIVEQKENNTGAQDFTQPELNQMQSPV